MNDWGLGGIDTARWVEFTTGTTKKQKARWQPIAGDERLWHVRFGWNRWGTTPEFAGKRLGPKLYRSRSRARRIARWRQFKKHEASIRQNPRWVPHAGSD